MNKAALREQSKILQPVVRIGKNGLTPNILEEILRQLKKKKLIKVKLLKAFVDTHKRDDAAKEIAASCAAETVQLVGNVMVLYKR